MSFKGKRRDEYVATTFCDFGQRGRRSDIGHHFSMPTAKRQFKRICRVWGNPLYGDDRANWRIWQETRGGKVINDYIHTPEPPYVPAGGDVGNRACRMAGGR